MLISPPHIARWAARLALLAFAVVSCWALAPALSARPYLPPAEDFGQRLGAVDRMPERAARTTAGRHREGPVTHVSDVLVAPARFDLAGLAGELRHYELRARDSGGEWTAWAEVGSGDPVWFGGADELQLRTRGWSPDGRVHYVNVSGDATPADAALTALRREVSHVSVTAATFVAGEPAEAELAKPDVISRAEWGAERRRGGCEPRQRPEYGGVRAAVVHHTVSANKYTQAEAPGMVLAICRYHRNANGWDDIGYNGVVDRFGNLYEGRGGGLGRAVVGAHAEGFNNQTSGVASLGTHTKETLSKAAMTTMADLIAWKLVKHNKTASGRTTLVSGGGSANRYDAGDRVRVRRIIGHRKLGLTECPGTFLHRDLDRLRRKVERRVEQSGGLPDDGGGGSGGVGD